MRRLLPLALLIGCGLGLGGCVVAYDGGPGYRRPYAYGYGYRYGPPPPGGYYYGPRPYRPYAYRRPYWW